MALGLIGLAVGSLLSAHEKEEENKVRDKKQDKLKDRDKEKRNYKQKKRRSWHYAELGLLKVLQLVNERYLSL